MRSQFQCRKSDQVQTAKRVDAQPTVKHYDKNQLTAQVGPDAIRVAMPHMSMEDVHNFGVAHIQQGHYEAALSWFDSYLSHSPGDPECLCNKGTALTRMGKPMEALIYLETALISGAHIVGVWFNRGLCLHCLNRNSEAKDSFQKAIALEPRLAETPA